MAERRFDDRFLFGAATAAFQIEGASHTDGRTDSIWDAFCRVDGAVTNGDDGTTACNHHHRYDSDVALMAALNLGRKHAEYAGPAGADLYVTENGAAFADRVGPDGSVDDQDRVGYLRAHLDAILGATADGVPVKGYFYWSLLDNFEWAWGYAKRFGIIAVDYATQRRTVKASGWEYANIIAARTLDPAAVGAAQG